MLGLTKQLHQNEGKQSKPRVLAAVHPHGAELDRARVKRSDPGPAALALPVAAPSTAASHPHSPLLETLLHLPASQMLRLRSHRSRSPLWRCQKNIWALLLSLLAKGGADLICKEWGWKAQPSSNNENTHFSSMTGLSSSNSQLGPKSSFWNDTFQGNNLVNLYSKFKRLDDAHHLFDEMPVRNTITRTSLMKGYSDIGNLESVFHVAHDMFCTDEEALHILLPHPSPFVSVEIWGT
ncbi:hypothetical protein FF1_036769 [Malus domestica]